MAAASNTTGTKTFEPSVAWPMLMALNGLAIDSNPMVENNVPSAGGESAWADVNVFNPYVMGKGNFHEDTMIVSLMKAMDPDNNPYHDGNHAIAPETPDDAFRGLAWGRFSSAIFSNDFATAAKVFSDDYAHIASWDNTAAELIAAQAAASGGREKKATARTFGNVFTMNAALKGMTRVVFHPEHVNANASEADFAAGITLNAKQQQGEMFLRRWSTAVRLWEAKQRGALDYFTTWVDTEQMILSQMNDAAQVKDDTLEKYRTWNLELWHYLLTAMGALSGAPVNPREMTKKERVLSAVTNSASVALQTGAAQGNVGVGLGFGAVSLAAQLWGMQ